MPRLALNLFSGLVQTSLLDVEPLPALEISLGSAPLSLSLIGPSTTLNRLEFAAKQRDNTGLPLWSGAAVVSGGVDLASPFTAITPTCSENWLALALVTLFATSPVPSVVNLEGQFRWRDSADSAWRYLAPFPINVRNTLFAVTAAGTELIPGGAQTGLAAIDNAAVSIAVVFPVAFASAPRLVLATVEKPAGGDNIFATVRRDTVTALGFTAELSGPAPDANHKLAWLAYL